MKKDRAFTLIEVAAAVVILALIVVPLLAARNATIGSAVKASQKMVLANLAASKLSEIACQPLEEVESSGNFEDHPECSWQFTIEPEEGEEEEPVELEEESGRPVIYRVRLVVSYPSASSTDERNELIVSTLIMEKTQQEEDL